MSPEQYDLVVAMWQVLAVPLGLALLVLVLLILLTDYSGRGRNG